MGLVEQGAMWQSKTRGLARIATCVILALSCLAEAASETAEARILNFPKGRSLGRLMIQDSGTRRYISSFHYWTTEEDTSWEYLGEARGNVIVPPGKRLALYVSKTGIEDLSPLSRLRPDDLYLLSLAYNPHADDRCMLHLSGLTGLKVLSLRRTSITSTGLRFIANFKSLERLSLPERITDSGLATVTELRSLKGLYFRGSPVTNAGLAHLAELTSIEELDLGGDRIDDAGLAHLAGLPRLRYLMLSGNFSDAGLVHLKKVPSLKILNINIKQFTNAGLAHLSDIAGLENLGLHWMEGITDDGLVHLQKMRSLKKLDINHARITDGGLVHLTKVPWLEYLHLPNHGLTDRGLAHVAELQRLKHLWVGASSNSPLSDAGVRNVAKIKSLEELYISGTGITDFGMAEIGKLTNLKKLGLFNVPLVTNEGLAELKTLKSLQNLSIRDSRVTISGLTHLNALSNLTELTVSEVAQDNSGLDISGLLRLEKLTLILRVTRVGDSWVSDEGRDDDLACLENMVNLKWFQGYEGIGDAGMAHLRNLARMERLNIGCPGLTDRGLSYLANMRRLDFLAIRDGNLTDGGLRHLERLKALAYLSITSQNVFSATALEQLQSELPNLQTFKIAP
jgi:Leucine-rich repeat (LRR) protein